MNEIKQLKHKLKKLEKELEQNKFFVGWLKSQIKLLELKELTEKGDEGR